MIPTLFLFLKKVLSFWRGGESDVNLGFAYLYLCPWSPAKTQGQNLFKKKIILSRIWVLKQDHGLFKRSVHTEGLRLLKELK